MKKNIQLAELLLEPVNLGELIDKLDFSEENIIRANREQPSLFLEASRYRVKKLRSRIQAESKYEMQQSKSSLFLRSLKKKGERGAITEGYIKDKVRVRPKVVVARKKFDNAQAHEEWAKLLLEAYRQRGSAIKTLAENLGAEANAQARLQRKDLETEGYEKLKAAVRKRYPGRSDENE
jgi:hypothetical protein